MFDVLWTLPRGGGGGGGECVCVGGGGRGGIPTAFSRLLLSVSLCVGSVTDTRPDGLLYCSVWLSVAAVLSATVSPRGLRLPLCVCLFAC